VRFGRPMLSHWALDPNCIYLNHGTVGAPPRRVLEAQQRLRDEIERHPSRFLLRELSAQSVGAPVAREPRLRAAANRVARFLGAEGSDLVFVDNATTGVNAVLRTFDLSEGDEVIVNDYTYGAIRLAAEYACRTRGAKLCVFQMPESVRGPEEVLDAVERAVTPRTRLAIVDHIASESALVMPLSEIAAALKKRGVAVLVDGAHAPGAIPVNIPSLGVDWYTGNLHKWAWSPRSSAVLWMGRDRAASIHSPVISWGLDQGLSAEFDWPGTRDPTPHLAAPEGIAFMEELGVASVQSYNHELAWTAGREMARHWGTRPLGPESMIGTMVTVPLPEQLGSSREDAEKLRSTLLFDDNIEVHLHAWKGRLRVRVSAQIYNEFTDVERLIAAIDSHS